MKGENYFGDFSTCIRDKDDWVVEIVYCKGLCITSHQRSELHMELRHGPVRCTVFLFNQFYDEK